jgi:hypothetical protein
VIASLVEALLRGGIPAIVAMQARLVMTTPSPLQSFLHLARREDPGSRAPADAARSWTSAPTLRWARRWRQAAEFATSALYVAGGGGLC